MKLLKDLKWSPDGVQIDIIPFGEYQNGEIPARAVVIAGHLGISEIIEDSGQDTNTPVEPETKKSKK
ncbi:hypothetical protein FCN80_24240 [Martelella alba]|uniref:Uncharacterized protein n=1 Tax=Martelella alba TaxID=2590451 RepID=A0ABY2SGL5_9HYPH|nr:hypothetical protein FCN80_24240 [Martelella alba]